MAKILYEVKQNQNSSSVAYGKWFAQVKTLETLNTRKLATHISEHGSIYTPDVVYGVLEKFRSCLIEMLLESKKVKIEGLGTFYTTLENTKGGAQSKDKFNVNSHLKALHIRFLPEQTTEENISSRQFLKQAEFINIDSLLKKEEETENGGDSTGGDNSGSQNQGGNSGSNTGNITPGGGDNSGSQNGDNSGSGSNQTASVAAPTIDGNTVFDGSTTVTMSGPEGAEIHYTTNGVNPTAESTLYAEPFSLSQTSTVKAIAIKNGVSSAVTTKYFTERNDWEGDIN